MNEKLENVQWGEYRIGDLFEKLKTKSVLKNGAGDLPATSAVLSNNQIGRYVSRENATILKNVFSATANGSGKAFYQPREFTVLQDSYAFKFINESIAAEKVHSFIVASLNKVYSKYDWGNKSGWVKVKEEKIQLPTKDGEIDFDFIAAYVSELEAAYVSELEAYLKASGLRDYHLTQQDEYILDKFTKLPDAYRVEVREYYALFCLEEVLNWCQEVSELNPLYLNNLEDLSQPAYPFYGQATIDNGIISYRQLKIEVLNNVTGLPTLLIHSNNQNMVYVETPFYLKDGHGATSVLQSENLNRYTALYFIATTKKVIEKRFNYNAKATKIGLKKTEIELPVVNDRVDYQFMSDFIKVVEKLVIKDLVDWTDKKIAATKEVIGQN
nr:restriction endonuclease subunit S [Canibacter zhuwentaonis]